MNKSIMAALGILLLSAGAAHCAETDGNGERVAVPTRSVLTGNAEPGEISIETGVTYTAQPPFNEPADPGNTRLLDGDKPIPDATKRTGINGPAQTLTFDLKRPYHVEAIELHFRFPQQPLSIGVSVGPATDGPWQNVAVLKAEEPREWWRLDAGAAQGAPMVARFVKLDFAGKATGWNINEVRILGASAQEVGKPRRREGQLILAEEERPYATIVLADKAYPNALRAAQLFQTLAQRTTGAELPIVPESRFDGRSTAVLIGDSALARRHGVAVEQTPFGDDRYVMRGGGRENFLALAGNDVRYGRRVSPFGNYFRGSLFAVYDFFERQGCGWFGPDELWQVVPKIDLLRTPRLAVDEVPAFKWRRIQMGNLPADSPLREAWRQGGVEIASWHNYNTLVPPEKYKEQHPDWFGPEQPDLTHPEAIRVAVETLSAQMDDRADQPVVTFPVVANDTGGFKKKPFNPAVGNVGAQQLYFANEIAKGLRAKYPNRRFILTVLAYWYSSPGPDPVLKAEPEVSVMIVNSGNHAKPLEFPESEEIARTTGRNNTLERKWFGQWKQTDGLTGVYEWWIPVLGNKLWKEAPWYDGDTAVQNLRFWHRNGIKYLEYEVQGEAGTGFPLRWPQYYIGAKAAWNPNIDPRTEMRIACEKLFGAAAEPMWRFYSLQERAMRATEERGFNWALPLPQLVYTPAAEEEGDSLLRAALLQVNGQRERARIMTEVTQWRRLREVNAYARANPTKLYKVIMNGVAMNWKEQMIDAATVRDLSDLTPDTPIEVLERDGQNRVALPGEKYDLEGGVTFRTLKP